MYFLRTIKEEISEIRNWRAEINNSVEWLKAKTEEISQNIRTVRKGWGGKREKEARKLI